LAFTDRIGSAKGCQKVKSPIVYCTISIVNRHWLSATILFANSDDTQRTCVALKQSIIKHDVIHANNAMSQYERLYKRGFKLTVSY